jgi:hypothetical protein
MWGPWVPACYLKMAVSSMAAFFLALVVLLAMLTNTAMVQTMVNV